MQSEKLPWVGEERSYLQTLVPSPPPSHAHDSVSPIMHGSPEAIAGAPPESLPLPAPDAAGVPAREPPCMSIPSSLSAGPIASFGSNPWAQPATRQIAHQAAQPARRLIDTSLRSDDSIRRAHHPLRFLPHCQPGCN
jgi:hypothetical protein